MVDEYKVETREDPEETKAQEGIEDRQKDSEMNGVVQASPPWPESAFVKHLCVLAFCINENICLNIYFFLLIIDIGSRLSNS